MKILNRTTLCCVGVLGLSAFASVARAQENQEKATSQPSTVLADVDHRKQVSLDGPWHYMIDPYDGGLYNFHREILKNGYFMNERPQPGSNKLVEYDFAKSPTLKVPGDWNTQRPDLMNYEGLLWYQRDFDYQPTAGHRTFLHIGAANYNSIFWVNTHEVCRHVGGFTAFDCDVTEFVHAGKNFVVAAVDDTRHADGVPTLNTDWYNYGGLTRDVALVDVPEKFIDDYDLHLNPDRTAIVGSIHVEHAAAGDEVTVAVPELKASVSARLDGDGRAEVKINPVGLQLWSPTHPKLYRVNLSVGSDKLEDDIGFRTIAVDGTRILLNGKPVFLRGIAIHAEAPYRGGRANNDKDVATLLDWAQQLGCNYVRLAHYPHDQRMTREADRRGLLVWSEVPVYWAVEFGNPAVLKNAQHQLSEEIRRDRNRASVILWSIANETPSTAERLTFLRTLARDVKQLDPTRLVTAALLVRTVGHEKYLDDPLAASLDVMGANEYIGWYEEQPADAEKTTWHISDDKPLIISEFGAGAKAGLHGPATQRWTEEYQADVFKHQLVMLNKIPQLRGMSPWLLVDFRSPVRHLPGIQDGFNRKGLISDQGVKKQAFFVLQKAYKDKTVGKAE